MTELLLAAEDRSSVAAMIDPVLVGVRSKLNTLCGSRASLQVLVSPPLYRPQPAWYRESLAWIANQFSICMNHNKPPNLHLLPSHINQDLAPDGVHLTAVAGLHYVLHLFDQSVATLASLKLSPAELIISSKENIRSHDDRLAYLENDHMALTHRVNHKTAADAEFDDFLRNKSEEDWFTVSGLPRLPSSLNNQQWQVQAKRQVKDMIRLVLQINKVQLAYEVLVVVNPIKWRTTGRTVYNVRLNSIEVSKRIRDLYSGFFQHSNPVKLPSSLKGVDLRNKITLNTKIRIAIMKQIGARYVEANQGASFKVRGYDSRPTIFINPPSGSTSKARSFTFMDAITSLPSHFTDERLTQIFMVIGTSNRGRLRQLFQVVSDDDHDRCLELVKKFHQDRRQAGQQARASAPTPAVTFAGSNAGLGSGMDLEFGVLSMLKQPPPPPPGCPSGVDSAQRQKKQISPPRGRAGKTSRTAPVKRSRRSSSESGSRKKRSRRSPSSSSSSSSSSGSSSTSSESSDSSPRRHRSRKKSASKRSRK